MRTTDNKKDTVLRVRIPENLRDHIYRKSKIKGVTVSQYMRDLIAKDMYK